MFEHTSRYYAIEVATLETPDGRIVRYVRRRFLPPSDRATVLTEVMVTEGERLDQIAARTLNDPEQYWRVCDANGAMRPADLVSTVGTVLRIPVPHAEGIA